MEVEKNLEHMIFQNEQSVRAGRLKRQRENAKKLYFLAEFCGFKGLEVKLNKKKPPFLSMQEELF